MFANFKSVHSLMVKNSWSKVSNSGANSYIVGWTQWKEALHHLLHEHIPILWSSRLLQEERTRWGLVNTPVAPLLPGVYSNILLHLLEKQYFIIWWFSQPSSLSYFQNISLAFLKKTVWFWLGVDREWPPQVLVWSSSSGSDRNNQSRQL